jgi:outer membrane protein insertion porin family
VLGNEVFGDRRLRKEMYTRQAGGLLGFLASNDTYDPDRLAADQQKLRAFYLTQGYADFRVVSALAELTPDRRDFVITYVVEEGDRYKFGTVEADSALRDFPNEQVLSKVKIEQGDWFNAKAVEDTVTDINAAAGNLGYAFADIDPAYNRDSEAKVMNLVFKVGNTPRVYVERIDITGNTTTRDKVIRREFRINEGDAFNALRLRRSQDRIQSLGYFQENLEIKQAEGSGPDRVILNVNVEEKPTGQLSLSGGYSSLERFVIQLSVSQNNFMGKGQSVDAGINWSRYSKSISAGFTDPYFMDKPILVGATLYRRDYSSFNYIGNERNTTYEQVSTGMALRTGFPLTEYWSVGGRYSLIKDEITLNKNTFYTNGECDPVKAGSYLCDEIGGRVTSVVGWSTLFDDTDGIRPTRGQRFVFSNDIAGLGGDVKYARVTANATKYHAFGDWVASVRLEGGYIKALQNAPRPFLDPVRLTDRFFGPQLRGFDIRGIGPRVQRVPYNTDGTLNDDEARVTDALGGKSFYQARFEVEFPISASLRNLGLRPSAYVDAGSLWSVTKPELEDIVNICSLKSGQSGLVTILQRPGDPACDPVKYNISPGFQEQFLGNSPKPRLSIGIGVNWVSPFGPLRIDLAKALLKQEGDDTKLFSFNVGTQF